MSEVGRRDEALGASSEAVKYYRELVVVNRDAYLPDLDIALSNFVECLRDLNREEEAVDAEKEAKTLRNN